MNSMQSALVRASRHIRYACVLLIIGPVLAQADAAFPDTPVGKQFATFVTAFNSGKPDILRNFVKVRFAQNANNPNQVEEITSSNMAFYGETHGITVRQIASTSPYQLSAIVQSKLTGFWFRFLLHVSDTAPYKIQGSGRSPEGPPLDLLAHRKLIASEVKAKVDDLMTKLTAADAFSGAILVARGAKPIYEKAFGLASRAWHIPNRLHTRFHLASVGKTFTAVAIAQLVEQGKLSYEDTIARILPDYPNKGVADKVTVRMLLTHTAGMPDWFNDKFYESSRLKFRTVQDYFPLFVNAPLEFEPGARFKYSNSDFVVLGAMIEKLSGETYFDYIRKHIFEPARMTRTGYFDVDSDPQNVATGYVASSTGPRHTNTFENYVKGGPSGGGYSTVEDMLKFSVALQTYRLLKENSLETLWTGYTDFPGNDSEYGYGFFVKRYNGTRLVGHGGGLPGVSTYFDIYRDLGYTVVILANEDIAPAAIAFKLREWLTQRALNQNPTAFGISANVSKSEMKTGQPVTISVQVKETGADAYGNIVDMEVKDLSGKQINQQFTDGQCFSSGETKTYSFKWTPTLPGKYTVDIGTFTAHWGAAYIWKSAAATIAVD